MTFKEDVKNMIIQEMKTGVAYYGDEHHEVSDFRLAPYESFINSYREKNFASIYASA